MTKDLSVVFVGGVSVFASIRLPAPFHITHLSQQLQLGQRSFSWHHTYT